MSVGNLWGRPETRTCGIFVGHAEGSRSRTFRDLGLQLSRATRGWAREAGPQLSARATWAPVLGWYRGGRDRDRRLTGCLLDRWLVRTFTRAVGLLVLEEDGSQAGGRDESAPGGARDSRGDGQSALG